MLDIESGVVLVLASDFDEWQEESLLLADASLELRTVPRGGLVDVDYPTLDRTVGLVTQWEGVTESMIAVLPNLRAIARVGAGIDIIDLVAAERRGISVVTSGDYATEEVAAHTLMLLLAHLRRLPRLADGAASGDWALSESLSDIPRLSMLTIGVVGCGRIGSRVAHLCDCLGLRVIVHDPHASSNYPSASSLQDLIRVANIVSLHVPLQEDTYHLIGAEEFSLMPPGAVLINVSRGDLVDETALLNWLTSERSGGAALDVFSVEPLPTDHPFLHLEKVIATPHMAYMSGPALREAKRRPFQELIRVLEINHAPGV